MVSRPHIRSGIAVITTSSLGDPYSWLTQSIESRSLTGSKNRDLTDERPNPFGAPGLLLDMVDSTWTERLEEALVVIEQLPGEFHSRLPRYMDSGLVENFRRLTRGMRKMRENVPPYREEFLVLAGPDGILGPLSDKFRNAIYCESVSDELAALVETQIAVPFQEAALQLRWRGGNFGIVEWAEEASDSAVPEPM